MSLQLELLLQYIQLKAPLSELDRIIDAVKDARGKQSHRIDDQIKEEARQLYAEWYDKYDFDGKFLISNFLNFELDATHYQLKICPDLFEITVFYDYDGKCRLKVGRNWDESPPVCVRDGCDKFDPITGDPRNIKYLSDFISQVHNKMQLREAELSLSRLE
jgi:hypothetical protein